jgi:hypothetical protein
MKSSCLARVRAVLFIAFWVMSASSIGVLALGISFAHAVPQATTSVSVSVWGINTTQSYTGSSGAAANLDVSYQDLNTPPVWYGTGVAAAIATSDTGSMGKVSVDVSGEAIGTSADAGANAYAALTLYFAPILRGSPPPFTPQYIPMDVTVKGACEAAGGGSAGGSYGVGDSSFVNSYRFMMLTMSTDPGNNRPQSFSDIFPTSASLGQTMAVKISVSARGACGVGPLPLGTWGGVTSFQAAAYIDPTISLDQAAFDAEEALLRKPTFTLSQYYSVAVSPNVTPVPVPGTIRLLGSGLVGLAGFNLRKKLRGLMGSGHAAP